MRLVEVAEAVREPRELGRDLGIQAGERRLKAHDARERLRPRPHPAPKKTIEMTRAHADPPGQIRDAEPAAGFLELLDRERDPRIDGRLRETRADERFEDVEAALI